MIVEQRNAIRIAGPRILSLKRKIHVVLAQRVDGRAWVQVSGIVPKAELALARHEIGAEHPAVVIQPVSRGHEELARL